MKVTSTLPVCSGAIYCTPKFHSPSHHSSPVHIAGSVSIALPCRMSLSKCKLPWATASFQSTVWVVMTSLFAITWFPLFRLFRVFYAFLKSSVDQLTCCTDEPKSESASQTTFTSSPKSWGARPSSMIQNITANCIKVFVNFLYRH